MNHYPFKIAICRGQCGVSYRGFGRGGRQYSIHKHKNHFTASLIAGKGQPITAMGRSPMEAIARAESLQEGEFASVSAGRRPSIAKTESLYRERRWSKGKLSP